MAVLESPKRPIMLIKPQIPSNAVCTIMSHLPLGEWAHCNKSWRIHQWEVLSVHKPHHPCGSWAFYCSTQCYIKVLPPRKTPHPPPAAGSEVLYKPQWAAGTHGVRSLVAARPAQTEVTLAILCPLKKAGPRMKGRQKSIWDKFGGSAWAQWM